MRYNCIYKNGFFEFLVIITLIMQKRGIYSMKNFLNALKESVCLIDEWEKICFMNTAFLDTLGYKQDEIDLIVIAQNILIEERKEENRVTAYSKSRQRLKGTCQFEVFYLEGTPYKGCIVEWDKEDKAKFLEAFLDSIEESVSIKDLEGHYVFANHKYAKNYHTSKEAIIGQNAEAFSTLEECKHIKSNEAYIIRTGEKLMREKREEKNGLVNYFEVTGMPLYDEEGKIKYIGAFKKNITVTKNLEHFVSESEHQFSKAKESYLYDEELDVSIDPLKDLGALLKYYYKTEYYDIWLYDKEEKNISAYFKNTLLKSSENEDVNFSFTFSMTDDIIQNCLKEGNGQIQEIFKNCINDEEYIPLDKPCYLIQSIIMYKGEFLGILVLAYEDYPHRFYERRYLMDKICNQLALIIKNKNLAEELQCAIASEKTLLQERAEAERALQLERMRSEFFANLSHEFRTPLNIILSASKLLEYTFQEHPKNKEIQKYLNYILNIKQNGYRLLKLVNNLIDITQIDSGYYKMYFANYNIIYIVEEIVNSVVDYAENNHITVIFDTEVEEEIIACDPEKIERIMLNLLSNAIKYAKIPGHINVTITLEQDFVVITVQDNGLGIPPDKLETIFERFIQANDLLTRPKEGSGIGLSLTKALVEMHGGHISVSSILGEETAFKVRLPRIQVEEERHYKESERYGFESNLERCHVEFSDIYTF